MQQHQQQQQHCTEERRLRLMDNTGRRRNDEFYAKLERIRLSAASSALKQRSAAELLDESKAFFVKSQEVLRHRQSLLESDASNKQKPMASFFRIPQPRRSPYQDCTYVSDRCHIDSFDFPSQASTHFRSTPSSTTDISDSGAFESVSLLSLTDQTTLDSTDSPSHIRGTVIPVSSLTVIERNARIIKWLFQLNKANATPSFQTAS